MTSTDRREPENMSEIAHRDTSAPHTDGRDGTRGAERAIRVTAVDDDPMVLDLIPRHAQGRAGHRARGHGR